MVNNKHESASTFITPSINDRSEFRALPAVAFEEKTADFKFQRVLKQSKPRVAAVYQKKEPNNLKDLVQDYFYGSDVFFEEKAFRRVMRWKNDFEAIAKIYPNVDWHILSAITKAETQGRTGKQVSPSKAIGMAQIKYQGAWSFIWDAMFSEKIKQGETLEKDYYNANLRSRYKTQVNRIKNYLEVNGLLVYPEETIKTEEVYTKARSRTWSHLKTYLERKYRPGQYQISVDIAAMYIDHLRDTFKKLGETLRELKQTISMNSFADFNNVKLSGVKKFWWDRVSQHIQEEWRANPKANKKDISTGYLDYFVKRLEDPRIYLAAYNFGIRNVLRYIEEVKEFPPAIKSYINDVTTYKDIFLTIERYGLYS